ncbi:MAG TPA: glycoside hydrolase domain-containing protein [Planctomycetota bacterium]|nr:glycoside hydrolase domain-containing protein [Planctomycetota bacterium]
MKPIGLLWLLILVGPATAATALWVESSGVMILPDRPPGGAREIRLSGVRSEFLTAQLGLRCDGPGEKALSFDWTALKGPRGEIAREHITLFRGAEIAVDHGQKVDAAKDPARARAYGSFPDALVPLMARDGASVANRIVPEKDSTISLWVDIFVPAGTPPGDYSGRIVLKGGEAEVASVPVTITVLDLEIPPDSTIPSMFNLRLHPHVRANLDSYVAEVMRHRIQPTNYHYVDYARDASRGWAVVDRLNPQGKGYVNVYYWQGGALPPEKARPLLDGLREITAHLKERGIFDHSFLHLADEPGEKAIPGLVEFARLVLQELPEWRGKVADTLNREGTELDQIVTHHIRALKCYGSWYGQGERVWGGREAWDKRRAAGQHLWFYLSNAQGVPYPTFDVHTVALAWEPRVLGWAYWYEKALGHLYWDLMFKPEWQLNKRFPPGDGQLIYPGDFALPGAPAWVQVKDLKGPVVSRRLKHQREGLEEWELLKLAEKKAGRAKVQAIVDRVYTCLGRRTWAPDAYDPAKPMWSYDEAAWDAARRDVLDLLLR